MVVNEELISARLHELTGSLASDLSHFSNWQEEADYRVITHVHWAVRRGCERVGLVVKSNDTDTVVVLIHYIDEFKECGLHELWVQFGTGEKRRMIPPQPSRRLMSCTHQGECHEWEWYSQQDGHKACIIILHADLLGFFRSLERHLFSLKQTFIKRNSTMYRQVREANPQQLRLEVHRHSVVGIGDRRTTNHIQCHPGTFEEGVLCDTKCLDVDSWCESAWPYSSRLD